MVADELTRRDRHLHFMRSGWLPAIRGFGRDTENTFVKTNIKKLGAVVAQTNENGTVAITLINRAGPAKKIHDKYGIVSKAIGRVMVGFAPYIRRKLGDEAGDAFKKIMRG